MSGYRVVAAIDFGTHGSGFAWAAVNETNGDMTQREIFYFDQWDAQQVVYPKNLSALLLDRAGNLLDWGYRAQERLRSEGLPEGRKYAADFKMSLQRNVGAGTLADDGNEHSAASVARLIELCVREVYQKALEHIKAGGVYTERDIAWCLTVPAIWDEYTKDLMVKAARRAGLPADDDRLRLALEPEAAALYCLVKGQRDLAKPGCRFMVIDAGGGTVDITSYKVERGPRLSQLAAANGAKAGSGYLNKFFVEDILSERLGARFVTEYGTRHPGEFSDLVAAWERAKRSVSATGDRPVIIPLPALVYTQAKDDGTALKRLMEYQDGIDTAIVIPAGELRRLFEKGIAAIIDGVARQLQGMRSAAGATGGEIALLVGGFAESPYLQVRLREYLEAEGVALHVPPRPSVAVLAGAAHFAYDPSVIRDRRSALTYGQASMSPFRDGIDPPSKRKKDQDGAAWCDDWFHVFVTRGEPVETDECRRWSHIPLLSGQTAMSVDIVATPDTNPVYTTDQGVAKVASFSVSLAGSMHLPREQREVETRLYFGDTRLRVEGENLHTGTTVKAEISWEPTW